jgi:hypothetical protein
MDDEFGDFAHLNSTGTMFDQLQKMKRNKAQGYTSKETTEKTEFEVLQDQMDKAAKEVISQRFCSDCALISRRIRGDTATTAKRYRNKCVVSAN